MTVQEYLDLSGLSEESFAERTNIKIGALRMWKNREMPERWRAAIENSIRAAPPSVDELDRAVDPEPVAEEKFEDITGRQSEQTPRAPEGAKLTAPPPTVLKMATVRGYIVAVYDGGARMARQRGDYLAGDVIDRYTPEFADAWVEYLESKPEILAWLAKLQVGTPLGNLIGVHVFAVGSYVIARQTAISMAERDAAERAAAENGAANHGAASPVGDVTG